MGTKIANMTWPELNSFIELNVMNNDVRVKWSPSSELSDAFAALERLKQDNDWWYSIHGRTCFLIDITDGNDVSIVPSVFYEDALPEAICRHIVACVTKDWQTWNGAE